MRIHTTDATLGAYVDELKLASLPAYSSTPGEGGHGAMGQPVCGASSETV